MLGVFVGEDRLKLDQFVNPSSDPRLIRNGDYLFICDHNVMEKVRRLDLYFLVYLECDLGVRFLIGRACGCKGAHLAT